MRRARRTARNILHYGSVGTKRVYEEGLDGEELLVEPFIALDEHQCLGLGVAVFEPASKRLRGAWFWGEEGPANPLALGRALVIVELLSNLRANTLCGAYLAAKGLNGDGPPCVHEVLSELGSEAAAILDQPPDCLDELLRELRQRHIPIETIAFARSA